MPIKLSTQSVSFPLKGYVLQLIFTYIAIYKVHFADLTEVHKMSSLKGCYKQGRINLEAHPATTSLLLRHYRAWGKMQEPPTEVRFSLSSILAFWQGLLKQKKV